MSMQIESNKNEYEFTSDSTKTDYAPNIEPKSRRFLTQQVPAKKSGDKNFKIRLFQSNEFPSISTKGNIKQKQFVLNSAIQKLIEQEIKRGKFFISSTQIKYPIKPSKKLTQKILTAQQIYKEKLFQMGAKKMKTMQLLNQLQKQQAQLKRKSVSHRYQKESQQRKSLKKQKSFFSPEQKRAVKKMLFRNKMLQNQLKQKTQRKLAQCRKTQEDQRQRYLSQLNKHKSLSKSKIQQRRRLIQLRKSLQQKQKQVIDKNYEQVKHRKYLFQQMLENDQKNAVQEMNQFTKKIEQIRTKMKVTLVEELKQHKKKYDQVLKPKSTQLKRSKFLQDMNPPSMKKIQENYFTRLAKAQRQSRKEQEELSRSRPFDLKEKVRQFSHRCENEIRPKIKVTEESRFIPIQRNHSLNSLNYFEQLQKGKEYLTIAKKLKKCETIEDEKVLNLKQFEKIPNPPAKISYKNYLKDMRRLSQHQSTQNARSKFALYLQKQGSISDYNSLQKAVKISQSIEAKNKKTRNQKLLDAVQNKIQLLKMIM